MMRLEEINEEISYCHKTGIFRWLKTGRGRKEIPGWVGGGGYISIRVLGLVYRAHRLAWFMHYGYMPPNQIDHIDGDVSNNAMQNLRLATSTQNNRNASLRSDNKSGIRGVSWDKREERWRVQISVDKKNLTVGYFKSLDDAKSSYANASKMHHGEFGKSL